MSECLKKEILMAFADRELLSTEMESTERHISTCASCKQGLESLRATSLKVNALLSSLAPATMADAEVFQIVRIPYSGANARMRWTAVASVGVLVAALILFVMIRHQHPASMTNFVRAVAPEPTPSVEKNEVVVAAVRKPVQVATPKPQLKVRQFQALDDGEPDRDGNDLSGEFACAELSGCTGDAIGEAYSGGSACG